MAEEIINIATLTIDKTEANKSIVDTKAQIFELQKANAELRKDISKNGDATGEQTAKFVANEQALKKLNAEYKAQSSAINDLTLAELKENKALTESVKSRDQAIAQNKELKAIRGQVNTETIEGAEALRLLNERIDDNDKYLKKTASTQEKASTITGNYRQALFSVDSALAQFGVNGEQARNVVKGFGEGITNSAKSFTDFTAKAGESTKATLGFKTSQQLAAESQAVTTAVTEAQSVASTQLASSQVASATATNVSTLSLRGFAVALAATGIGLIVIAVAALISYLSKLDPVMDAIEQITSGVAAAFSSLGKAIASLDFSNLVGGMEEAYSAAVALKEAQQELADLQRSQEVSNAKASQQYDELILKSKNRTLTEKERVAFINQAQKIEEQNFKQRSNLADAELKNAIEAARIKGELSQKEIANLKANTLAYGNYLLNTGKITEEQLEAIKKAELGKIEIRSESTRRLEKSQNAEDKLLEDAEAKRKEAADKEKDRQAKITQARLKTLNESVIIFEQEKKTTEQRLEFYTQYYEKLNKLQNNTEAVANANALSLKILSITSDTISEELELQKQATEERKKLSQDERDELIANSEFLKKVETERVENSKLSERDKALALEEIQKGYLDNIAIINTNFETSEKERKALAAQEEQTLRDVLFETRLLELEEQGLAESEVQRSILALQLEQKKADLDEELRLEKKTAAEVNALKTLEDKKYAAATKKIDKEVAASKRVAIAGQVQDAIAAAQSIFGESKALAIASALINTYQGITAGVALGYPMAIPAVAIASLTGFAAVKNILKTNKDGGGGGGAASSPAASNTSVAASVFENPARTQNVATVNAPPLQAVTPSVQPVLVLETLTEAQQNQLVKIKS